MLKSRDRLIELETQLQEIKNSIKEVEANTIKIAPELEALRVNYMSTREQIDIKYRKVVELRRNRNEIAYTMNNEIQGFSPEKDILDRESIMTCSFWDLEGPEKPSILSWMDENQPPQDASPYNKECQEQIKTLTKQLDQTNKMYKKCLLENANNADLLKTKDQLLEKVDKSQKSEREVLDKKYDLLNKVKEQQEKCIKKLQEQIMVQEKLIKGLIRSWKLTNII